MARVDIFSVREIAPFVLAVTLALGGATVLPAQDSIPAWGSITAGAFYTLQLKGDGTVWAWGANGSGQLGDGTIKPRTNTAVQVSGLSGGVSITAGYHHSLALKGDGTVWAWGFNGNGELGDGTSTQRVSPVQVNGLSGVVAIAAGWSHSLALKSDGTVWSWGSNADGQLGDGTSTSRSTAVQVSGLSGVVSIAAGHYHSSAVKNDGTVWAWGNDAKALPVDQMTARRRTPVQVSGLGGVVAVAAGHYHTLALRRDGTVWAWGWNSAGQVGDGTTTQRGVVEVRGLSDVAAIAAGRYHSLALKRDGTVWVWGDNGYGQLGDNTTIQKNSPVQASGLGGVVAIAGGSSHSVALNRDGKVWTWGFNGDGQLGDVRIFRTTTPLVVENKSDDLTYRSIAAGAFHNLKLKRDGTLWAWGANGSGQLGDGASAQTSNAVKVTVLSGGVEVAAGHSHSLALKNDGKVWAWGDNTSGQLGDGTTTQTAIAVRVSGLSGVVAIAAGQTHSLALKSDGTVWAWGSNTNGLLGDGTTANRSTAVQVSGMNDVAAIAAGYNHSLALKSDGSVWAWGDNVSGQLGDGATMWRVTPVQVVFGHNGVVAIAAGRYHSIALKRDGTVLAWGWNNVGQLGDGTTIRRLQATAVSGLSGVVAITAGSSHGLAMKRDGTVWAWGENTSGQLGDNTTIQRNTAVQVSGLSEVVATAAGSSHSLALRSDGSVWAWGDNASGQLGNKLPWSATPVVIQSETSACTYGINPGGLALPPGGGRGTISIGAGAGCAWTISNPLSWVSIAGANSGTGNSTVSFQVAPNSGGRRTGTITIAGLPFTIEQASSSTTGFNNSGSMAQLASGGYWRTTITLINSGAAAAQARLSFFDDNGNPLPLPLTFPQIPPAPGPLLASTLERTINAGAVLVIDTTGPDSSPPLMGWAQLLANGNVSGFAVFQQKTSNSQQEAVVPLENRNVRSYLLYFDNTNGFATGVALAAMTTQAMTVAGTIRDDAGEIMLSTTVTLPAQGHTAFDLVQRFPVTAQKRGTVEFATPATGQIVLLGLRFSPVGAFTTVPPSVK